MNAKSSFQEELNTLYLNIFHKGLSADTGLADKALRQVGCAGSGRALALFYALFAGEKDFMKCLYDIKLPEELDAEDGFLLIAKEQQGVCAYGVEIATGKVFYLDDTNRVAEPVNMGMEDFILWLIAVQCSQFRPCDGRITNCREDLETRFRSQRITTNSCDGAVYCFDGGAILAITGNDAIISAKDDSTMEAFEEITGFEVDYF